METNTRILNLRKLQLQLLFGPGIISCVGPPASGKTTSVMRMLCDNGGGAASVLGPSAVDAASNKTRQQQQLSSSPSSFLIDAAVSAAMLTAMSASGGIAEARAVHYSTGGTAKRRKRDGAAASAADSAAATTYQAPPPAASASVVAYVSAASATSASAAVRRLGREARRSAQVWLETKGVAHAAASSSSSSAFRAATGYTNAEAKSLDGAVAAASVDIRAAYEELQAAVAARNRASITIAQQAAAAAAAAKRRIATRRKKNLEESDDDDSDGEDEIARAAQQVLPQFLPPVLHLVLDDIDLLHIKEKQYGRTNNFQSGGGGGGGGGFSGGRLKLGAGLTGYDDPVATGTGSSANWESIDGVLQALYRNISLANVTARGKKWGKPNSQQQQQQQQNSSTDLLGAPLLLHMEDSEVSVPVFTSSGIYIWCISQMPFEARTLAERTIYFMLPKPREIAAEAAKMAFATLFSTSHDDGGAGGGMVSASVQKKNNENDGDDSESNDDDDDDDPFSAKERKSRREERSKVQQQKNSSNFSIVTTLFTREHIEKACFYYCTEAPTCHTITVRDCRLLATRVVSVFQKMASKHLRHQQQQQQQSGKSPSGGSGSSSSSTNSLTTLPKILLAEMWGAAVQSEDQQAAARREAESQQNQMLLAAAGLSHTDATSTALALMAATTAGLGAATKASKPGSFSSTSTSSSSASSLVASMRCLPVTAQILAVACFCCGALSDAQLRAVLSDTAGAVKQARRTAGGRSNALPMIGSRHIFTMESAAWVYDALLKVAIAIQSKQTEGAGGVGVGNRKKTSGIIDFFGADAATAGKHAGKTLLQGKMNAEEKKKNNNDDDANDAIGTCCWTPGQLSSCLPSGAAAVHHLLALEALGVIAPSRAAATVKYRCALLPMDAAAIAAKFGLDLWQLTTSTSIRGA